jgi:hypothetical protein
MFASRNFLLRWRNMRKGTEDLGECEILSQLQTK